MDERQLNDLMFSKLSSYNGDTLNDRLTSWLKAQGAVGGDVTTLWHSFWDVKLITQADSFNDRMVMWLKSEGATGTAYNDLKYSFWDNFVP